MRLINIFLIFLVCSALLQAQETDVQPVITQKPGEPFTYVGMTLNEIIEKFGPPRSVYTARGEEIWQDDVVFIYDEGDFYIFGDRVWQIAIKNAYGIKIGDLKGVAILILGDEVIDEGDYILYSLHGFGWPLSLRAGFTDGRISTIFIYRPDF